MWLYRQLHVCKWIIAIVKTAIAYLLMHRLFCVVFTQYRRFFDVYYWLLSMNANAFFISKTSLHFFEKLTKLCLVQCRAWCWCSLNFCKSPASATQSSDNAGRKTLTSLQLDRNLDTVGNLIKTATEAEEERQRAFEHKHSKIQVSCLATDIFGVL